MADRSRPVTLRLNADLKVRCASGRKYGVVQIVWHPTKRQYLPKVVFRSDSARRIAERIRRTRGYHFVYELQQGQKLWENTSTEWLTAEQAIIRYETRRTVL